MIPSTPDSFSYLPHHHEFSMVSESWIPGDLMKGLEPIRVIGSHSIVRFLVRLNFLAILRFSWSNMDLAPEKFGDLRSLRISALCPFISLALSLRVWISFVPRLYLCLSLLPLCPGRENPRPHFPGDAQFQRRTRFFFFCSMEIVWISSPCHPDINSGYVAASYSKWMHFDALLLKVRLQGFSFERTPCIASDHHRNICKALHSSSWKAIFLFITYIIIFFLR